MFEKIAHGAISLIAGTAGSHAWQSTNQLIPNYQAKVRTFNKTSGCTIRLPDLLPKTDSKRYYLYTQKKSFSCTAYINKTESCKTSSHCNVGTIIQKKGSKPNLILDDKLQPITKMQIEMSDKQNYTYYLNPGKVKSDYNKANIQWQHADTLYVIIYPTSNKNLLTMANNINSLALKR